MISTTNWRMMKNFYFVESKMEKRWLRKMWRLRQNQRKWARKKFRKMWWLLSKIGMNKFKIRKMKLCKVCPRRPQRKQKRSSFSGRGTWKGFTATQRSKNWTMTTPKLLWHPKCRITSPCWWNSTTHSALIALNHRRYTKNWQSSLTLESTQSPSQRSTWAKPRANRTESPVFHFSDYIPNPESSSTIKASMISKVWNSSWLIISWEHEGRR